VNVRCFASDQLATGIKRRQMKRTAKMRTNAVMAARISVTKSGVVSKPLTAAMTAAAINARFITGLIKL
jgi:hypothetical protein